MTVSIFKDYYSLSLEAADAILEVITRKQDAVLCLAAGDTPRLAYSLLAQRAANAKEDLSKCTFIGLDEWVGIPPENEGSCAFFLNKNLFRPLRIQPQQVHLFDALSPDLSLECQKMDAVIIEKGGIDLMLVGVGMNGHIGFNEPGTSEDLQAHVVQLDATTQSVGQKYFAQTTTLQQGITLGIKQFINSREAIMMATGKKKADVMRLALEGPVTMQVPASIIRKHAKGRVMVDEEAARLTGREV